VPKWDGERVVSEASTYGSKYSSGTPSLGGWGDPGPSVVPGSVGGGSALRSGAANSGLQQVYGPGGEGLQGSLAEMRSRKEGVDDDAKSFESLSSRGGVGKAR